MSEKALPQGATCTFCQGPAHCPSCDKQAYEPASNAVIDAAACQALYGGMHRATDPLILSWEQLCTSYKTERDRARYMLDVERGVGALPPGWKKGKNGAYVKLYPSGALGVVVEGRWHLWEKTDAAGGGAGRDRGSWREGGELVPLLVGMELCDAVENPTAPVGAPIPAVPFEPQPQHNSAETARKLRADLQHLRSFAGDVQARRASMSNAFSEEYSAAPPEKKPEVHARWAQAVNRFNQEKDRVEARTSELRRILQWLTSELWS